MLRTWHYSLKNIKEKKKLFHQIKDQKSNQIVKLDIKKQIIIVSQQKVLLLYFISGMCIYLLHGTGRAWCPNG